MKHHLSITLILITLFVLSQVLGLFFLQADAEVEVSVVDNETVSAVVYDETVLGERPEFEHDYGALLYLIIGVAAGTILLLMLIRLKLGKTLWKVWYFLAVLIAISLALGVFLSAELAAAIAVVLAVLKLKFRDFISHNVTELLMYAGLAVLLAPLFDLLWVIILLVIISLYDMYAVWKSKHMVSLAKFTSKADLFPGLMMHYKQEGDKAQVVTLPNTKKELVVPPPKGKTRKVVKSGVKQAILGGGDVIFPLLFVGVVFADLFVSGYSKANAFLLSLIVTGVTTISLFLLFYLAKKDHFYPAMPFISAGCFVGLIVLKAVLLL